MPLPYKGMCDWRLCHQTCSLHGASCPQRARCIRFLQKSSKNHDFHLADFACVWYIFILWTKNLLGNTAQLQLRPSPDIFRRSIGLKSLRYTKYICAFQTSTRRKISHHPLLIIPPELPCFWETLRELLAADAGYFPPIHRFFRSVVKSGPFQSNWQRRAAQSSD